MRYLLTGATGYIGAKLAAALADLGYDVHAIVRPSSNRSVLDSRIHPHIYSGETERIHEIFGQCNPEIVVHLAAEVGNDEHSISIRRVRESNIEFGCRILEAMLAYDVMAFINVGSYSEYGSDGEFKPKSYYAATKRAFQNIVTYYCEHGGLRAKTLVLYDVYGADDWRKKFLPYVLKTAKAGSTVQATPGDQIIGPIHINDVVAAFLLASDDILDRGKESGHQVCFLNPHTFVSLKGLIDQINDVLTTPIEVEWAYFPYRRSQIMIPYRDGIDLPSWKPVISLRKGILELVRQYSLDYFKS